MTEQATRADVDVRLDMYRKMQEGRLFEKRAHDLFLDGLVNGTSHLGARPGGGGRRVRRRAAHRTTWSSARIAATSTRCCAARRWARLMAELMGRATGICGGKGGSMHLTDVEHGAMGSYAIVGAHMPIAAGAAWAAQERGTGQVAVCFFGDGTTNIGAFHEALNMAVDLEAARGLRLREQPLYGVHGDRRRDGGRASGGRPRLRVRTGADPRRRQRRRTRCTRPRVARSTGRGAAKVRRSSRR